MIKMKKAIVLLISIILSVTFVAQASTEKSSPVENIRLDKSSISLKVGQTHQLVVKFTPSNTAQKKLTYSSSDKKVATINNSGKISAIGVGTAFVTVSSDYNKKIQGICKLTVSRKDVSTPTAALRPINKYYSVLEADTIMKRYPDPDRLCSGAPWSYETGYVLYGMENVWRSSGDIKYFDYIKKFADKHVQSNGDITGFTGETLDNIMAGALLVTVYEQTGEDKYLIACNKIRDALKTYPVSPAGAFWHMYDLPNELWLDGVFMGECFSIRYGKVIGDTQACYDEACTQILLAAQYCTKPNSGLLYHAWSEDKKASWADTVSGCSPAVWARSLGWYAMILVETLDYIPEDQPQRKQMLSVLTNLMKSLKDCQDSSKGLWYQVVDSEDPRNWLETSGSAMYMYSMQRAIDSGYIEAAVYQPVVDKAYKGIISEAKINTSGLVDLYGICDGCGVYDETEGYYTHPTRLNAAQGVGAFLMATDIYEKPNLPRH